MGAKYDLQYQIRWLSCWVFWVVMQYVSAQWPSLKPQLLVNYDDFWKSLVSTPFRFVAVFYNMKIEELSMTDFFNKSVSSQKLLGDVLKNDCKICFIAFCHTNYTTCLYWHSNSSEAPKFQSTQTYQKHRCTFIFHRTTVTTNNKNCQQKLNSCLKTVLFLPM